GRRLREGSLRNVAGVPSSSAIAAVARESGVPLTTLDEHPVLDLDLDGADEVDPNLNLIKGLGGALLWEKIVAVTSKLVVILVDESKLVDRLGSKAPLPVEVIPFGWRTHHGRGELHPALPVRWDPGSDGIAGAIAQPGRRGRDGPLPGHRPPGDHRPRGRGGS
ncbi:MAG: ribose-5-phosphate isomerase A, partial [candidate division NC10 bacterium]|nr:ribose-5-phosphate isomerase A [candidate division NC10 bacterium]